LEQHPKADLLIQGDLSQFIAQHPNRRVELDQNSHNTTLAKTANINFVYSNAKIIGK